MKGIAFRTMPDDGRKRFSPLFLSCSGAKKAGKAVSSLPANKSYGFSPAALQKNEAFLASPLGNIPSALFMTSILQRESYESHSAFAWLLAALLLFFGRPALPRLVYTDRASSGEYTQ